MGKEPVIAPGCDASLFEVSKPINKQVMAKRQIVARPRSGLLGLIPIAIRSPLKKGNQSQERKMPAKTAMAPARLRLDLNHAPTSTFGGDGIDIVGGDGRGIGNGAGDAARAGATGLLRSGGGGVFVSPAWPTGCSRVGRPIVMPAGEGLIQAGSPGFLAIRFVRLGVCSGLS